MRALLSIHDVMPETLDRVGEHISALRAHGHEAITLLVVPGRDWGHEDLAQLARWQMEGLELAAHGWYHHADRLRGPYHWLHAALISRRAAEHLALDGAAIAALMQAAHDWFPDHGLAAPTTYVPPAWALGSVEQDELRPLPYHRIEVTRGIVDAASGELTQLPLVGFEADTPLRAAFLRRWNRWQAELARQQQLPLRIGIHPQDNELRLADDLDAFIRQAWRSMRYRDFDTEPAASA